MSKFYVQYDNNGVVFSVNRSGGEIIGGNMIEIPEMDFSLIGATYDPITKKFTPVAPKVPEPDQRLAALDALMSGQIDTATQSANANDAIMNAMIDIQTQLDEIKTKLGVV